MSDAIQTNPQEYEDMLLLDLFIRAGYGKDNPNVARIQHEGKDDVLRELRAKKAGVI